MDTVKINQPMPENNKCPQCGTPLPSGALAGLCPACLLKQGAAADTVTDAKQPPFNPPIVAELAPLFPQLEIIELIGKGGMGAVYKARQKQLDRFVALKILPPGVGRDAAFAERFTREAKALARLNHPGIVTLYEFGMIPSQTPDGAPLYFFLMEFVDGVNLRQLLHGGRVSSREALAIVPQICDALQFAHDQGIVHRDIKPENILLDRRGRVKVADFGLAKIIGGKSNEPAATGYSAAGSTSITDAGKVLGTPNYMSPEQITAPGEVDHRADIYALGVVFYQMLTGELPGKSIEPPSKKVQVDVRLDEIVLRALEKKPELRYQQASVLKTQVETVASDASPAPVETPKPRRRLRKFFLIQLPATIVIILVIRTFFLAPYRVETDADAPEVPQGSHFLVWKLARHFEPGDMIAYREKGVTYLVRVVNSDPTTITVNRNGVSNFQVPRANIIGKVICIYWRGSSSASAKPEPQVSANFHVRVFESDASLVDHMLPHEERQPGVQPGIQSSIRADNGGTPTTTFTRGNFTISLQDAQVDSEMVETSSNILDVLIDNITSKPGMLADQSRLVCSGLWPSDTADSWGYTRNDVLSFQGNGGGNVFYGIRNQDGSPEIRIEAILSHTMESGPIKTVNGIASRLLYEGKMPPAHVMAFLVPFLRNDGSAHYLVIAYEITPPATGANSANNDNAGMSDSTNQIWSPPLNADGKPDVDKILSEVRTLMDQGQYEQALQRQLWYFNHAQDYGVANSTRCSMGMMNWGELARLYPPARQALIDARNRGAEHIENGDCYFDLFMEVESLNTQLHDDNSTYNLFKIIGQKDAGLARNCYPLIEDVLVKDGDYQLCLDYMGKPEFRFDSIRADYLRQMAMNQAWEVTEQETREMTGDLRQKNGWTNMTVVSLTNRAPSMDKSTQRRFVGQVRELIEILVGTGNREEAQEIEDKALTVVDDPLLRSAVNDAIKKTGVVNSQNKLAVDDTTAASQAIDDWLALLDAGDYSGSWQAASESFQNSVTRDTWVSMVKSVRQPLGKVASRIKTSAQISPVLPGMTQGPYCVETFQISFDSGSNGVETVSFQKSDDGKWKAIGYLIRPRTAEETAAVTAAEKWLAGIDDGNYAESWTDAADSFQKAVTQADWISSLNSARKPLGKLQIRTVNSTATTTQMPGAADGKYVVMQFITAFANMNTATETVTFELDKNGDWKASGYYIK